MSRHRTVELQDIDLPAALSTDRNKGDQIREALETLAISRGPGAAMPSDRQLADHFGVARMTVRNEVQRLVADGLLTVRAAAGTFVAEQPRVPFQMGTSYSLSTQARAGIAGTRILEHTVLEMTARQAAALEARERGRALRLVRVRTLNDEPIGIERVLLPLERFPGLDDVDLERASLYGTLSERWAVRGLRSTGTAAAVRPSREDATLLDIATNEPCMLVTMTTRDRDGIVVESGRSVYRGDRYEISVDQSFRADIRR